ncbi:MAG: tripartite tricarboxylate transporter substrate binding protein [Betaproteobacteria bacterium]|nr:tripartite tricarboxylate transporter substrate binding protein [Betaproteobacteria bacterium]
MAKRFSWTLLAAAAIFAATSSYSAEPYPAKPIKLVLPLAPGGATDNLARIVGSRIVQTLGQPIIIENRPGAGGIIASEVVARAAPDGYTLLLANFATHAVAPTMFKTLPYDPIIDFAPVSLLASSPHLLMVTPSLPAKNLSELLALAKSGKQEINYASSGIGSPLHLAGEYFKIVAGIDMLHVAYKSSGPALLDMVAGRVHVMFDNLSTALPYVQSGKLRGIAVTSANRSALAPDIATVAELGLRDFQTYGWRGVLAPAKTPRDIVNKLADAHQEAMKAPQVKDVLVSQGYDTLGTSPQEFALHIRREIDKWAPVIRAAGVTGN